MNRKRNVAFIKPDDPEFLKVLKRQAGYDDRNHKFDHLQNADEDFVEDEDSEKPQVVVLKEGDLTSEQAEEEQKRLEKVEAETKADLTQKVIFKQKPKPVEPDTNTSKRKHQSDKKTLDKNKKSRQLLSFGDEEADEDEAG